MKGAPEKHRDPLWLTRGERRKNGFDKRFKFKLFPKGFEQMGPYNKMLQCGRGVCFLSWVPREKETLASNNE